MCNAFGVGLLLFYVRAGDWFCDVMVLSIGVCYITVVL